MQFLKGFMPGFLSILISAGHNKMMFMVAMITTLVFVIVVAIKLMNILKEMRIYKKKNLPLNKFIKDYYEKQENRYLIVFLKSLTYFNMALLLFIIVDRFIVNIL